MELPITFDARVVRGSGRGRKLGAPTYNLRLEDVPPALLEGIYACRARTDGGPWEDAVMHHGPRPVFQDTRSCEVHLLRGSHDAPVARLEVEAVAWLREVLDFPTPEDLYAQIASDIAQARAILDA